MRAGPQVAVVDSAASPSPSVRQQDCERDPFGVLQRDADGVVAELGHTDVGDDGRGAQLVSLRRECADQSRDQVSGVGPFVTAVRGHHALLAVGVHCDCEGMELAVLVQLLLGEAQSEAEQAVEVVLSC